MSLGPVVSDAQNWIFLTPQKNFVMLLSIGWKYMYISSKEKLVYILFTLIIYTYLFVYTKIGYWYLDFSKTLYANLKLSVYPSVGVEVKQLNIFNSERGTFYKMLSLNYIRRILYV